MYSLLCRLLCNFLNFKLLYLFRVGGMASTRGSGLSTLMYGTTAENVVSLRVVTPEGKLIRTRRRVRKSATGYELTQLFVGSEGTLGVIVELTLKVQRLPKVH